VRRGQELLRPGVALLRHTSTVAVRACCQTSREQGGKIYDLARQVEVSVTTLSRAAKGVSAVFGPSGSGKSSLLRAAPACPAARPVADVRVDVGKGPFRVTITRHTDLPDSPTGKVAGGAVEGDVPHTGVDAARAALAGGAVPCGERGTLNRPWMSKCCPDPGVRQVNCRWIELAGRVTALAFPSSVLSDVDGKEHG
jgi:hypothetical protein